MDIQSIRSEIEKQIKKDVYASKKWGLSLEMIGKIREYGLKMKRLHPHWNEQSIAKACAKQFNIQLTEDGRAHTTDSKLRKA
jgi:hypothetical protein